MAAKKKTKKKQTKPRKASRKGKPSRKTAKKKVAKKKASLKKASAKKPASKRTRKAPKKIVRRRSRSVDTEAFLPEQLEPRSGRQSGDLQGLSDVEAADSESVNELLEEGNAFEADVVAGVEEATNSDEREVRTREVPEDDVPEEYLDEE
jgi:hypothetical protein